jgi:hypothetical protein
MGKCIWAHSERLSVAEGGGPPARTASRIKYQNLHQAFGTQRCFRNSRCDRRMISIPSKNRSHRLVVQEATASDKWQNPFTRC